MREAKRKNPKAGRKKNVLLPPVWTGHADFIHPFDFISFWRMVGPLDVDVMLEAKAKDLALLRLRKDLARYADREVAALFGVETLTSLKEAEEPEIEIDPAELESA